MHTLTGFRSASDELKYVQWVFIRTGYHNTCTTHPVEWHDIGTSEVSEIQLEASGSAAAEKGCFWFYRTLSHQQRSFLGDYNSVSVMLQYSRK